MPEANDIRAGGAFVEIATKDNTAQGNQQAEQGLYAWSQRVAAGVSSRLSKAFEWSAGKLEGFSSRLAHLGEKAFGGMEQLPEPLASLAKFAGSPGGVVTAFGEAAREFANASHELEHLSTMTGMTAENLSVLGFAADQSGASVEEMASAIQGMQKKLAQAALGGKEGAAFKALGIDPAGLRGLAPDQQFLALGRAVAGVADPALRAGLAMQVFGREGRALLPLLGAGPKGFEDLAKAAEHFGLVADDKAVEAGNRLWRTFSLLKSVTGSVVQALGAAVAPQLEEFGLLVSGALAWLHCWIDANHQAIADFFETNAAIVAVGGGLLLLSKGLDHFAGLLKLAGPLLGALVGGLFSLGGGLLALAGGPVGLLIGGVAALLYATGALGAAWGALTDGIGRGARFAWQQVEGLVDIAMAAGHAIMDALSAGDTKVAWEVFTSAAALAWEQVKEFGHQAWEGIWATAAEMAGKVGASLVRGIMNAIATAATALETFFSDMGMRLLSKISIPLPWGGKLGIAEETEDEAKERRAQIAAGWDSWTTRYNKETGEISGQGAAAKGAAGAVTRFFAPGKPDAAAEKKRLAPFAKAVEDFHKALDKAAALGHDNKLPGLGKGFGGGELEVPDQVKDRFSVRGAATGWAAARLQGGGDPMTETAANTKQAVSLLSQILRGLHEQNLKQRGLLNWQ